MLLVDRLLTESTLEAAIESRNHSMQAPVDDSKVDCYPRKVDLGDVTTTEGKLAECRICQDDDVDSNMETPCFCRGSLKVCLFSLLVFRIIPFNVIILVYAILELVSFH